MEKKRHKVYKHKDPRPEKVRHAEMYFSDDESLKRGYPPPPKKNKRYINISFPETSINSSIQEKEAEMKMKKTKKLKYHSTDDESSSSEEPYPKDPNELTYCVCQQISYGEMILCDNDLCPIEWFHFSCVGLTKEPKRKWYCPRCRGNQPNMTGRRKRSKRLLLNVKSK